MRLSNDDLPMFFDEAHATLAKRLHALAPALEQAEAGPDAGLVNAMARAQLFELVCAPKIDTRSLCLAREMLGYVSPRADSIFAVQGLGVQPILLAGSEAQKKHVSAFARGAGIAAFALTEPEAGSDVAAIQTRAAPTAEGFRIDGDKLFISNLGIADHAVVIASTEPELGAKGLTAFWVPLNLPGVTVKPLTPTAPHPIGALELRGVVVPASARIGEVGQGMKLAMQTLDQFRVSVGAAAVGMARRALDEALGFVTRRIQFGKLLAEQPLIQATLADMQVDLDAARLLVLRRCRSRSSAPRKAVSASSIAPCSCSAGAA
jgi:acyl-CoA dehydrogenase